MLTRITIFILLLSNSYCLAQKTNTTDRLYGVPFMTHYSPSDYNAHRQNWSIIQDDRGIIYVGNTSGLLEFDGLTWRLYETPNKTPVRSLGKDSSGRIYYGAQDDFGYLDNDDFGNLKLVSLVQDLPKLEYKLEDVWRVINVGETVYFQTLKQILSLESDQIFDGKTQITLNYESENAKQEVNGLSVVGNTLYFWIYGKGLMTFEEGKPRVLQGGKNMLQSQITSVLSFDELGTLLICTLSDGFYIFDGQNISSFEGSSAFKTLLKENRISETKRLADGTLAVMTSKAGVVIVDGEGEILQRIDASMGLQSNNIYASYIDEQGGLWVGTSQGISRIETPSPTQYFGPESGLNGRISSFVEHKNDLYLSSRTGIYKLESDVVPTRFTKISNTTDDAYSLESFDDLILAAFPYLGTYQFQGDRASIIIDKDVPVKVKRSRFDSKLVFIGSGGIKYGFSILYRVGNEWQQLFIKPIVSEQIREIEEEAPGIIWLGTRNEGYLRLDIPALQTNDVSKIQFKNGDTLQVSQKRFTKRDTTTAFRSRLYYINDKLEFATSVGHRKIDNTSGQLILDRSLHPNFADSTIAVNIIRQAADSSLWVYTNATENTIVKLLPEKNQYNWEEIPGLNRALGTTYTAMLPDPENKDRIFLGTPNGVVTYNSSIKRPFDAEFNTLIRSVYIEEDSLVFNGNWFNTEQARESETYNYSRKAIIFSYTSTSYDLPERTEYQYALQGYDNNWSEWSLKSKKEYTNLPGGDYVFKVRAKNIYGVESSVGEFQFTIRPPWFLSNLAYVFYVLCVLGGFLLVLIYSRRRLERRQRVELTKMENKLLKNEIEYKKKDLADFALNISRNQQWNNYLLGKMEEINEAKGRKKGTAFANLQNEIKAKNNVTESNFEFQKRVDVLSNEFYNTLLERYPTLTKTELKLCSLIRLSLDNYDIATLQNIDISSVYTSRYRLRKKLNISSDTDLDTFLKGF